MAEAEEWRSCARDRASEAADRCGLARGLLTVAAGRLAQPMRAANAPFDLLRARVTEDLLVDASSNLAVAASLMEAAKLVALRGVAVNPEEPLLRLQQISDLDEPVLRLALSRLRGATTRAGNACLALERGRGHLLTACQLLGFELLPGVDGFLDAERAAAHQELDAALELAVECATLTRGAYNRLR